MTRGSKSLPEASTVRARGGSGEMRLLGAGSVGPNFLTAARSYASLPSRRLLPHNARFTRSECLAVSRPSPGSPLGSPCGRFFERERYQKLLRRSRQAEGEQPWKRSFKRPSRLMMCC